MDLHNSTKFSEAFAPKAAVTDNTPQVSNILDTANFGANELAIVLGTLTDADATFALTMDEGDAANLSDAAAVDAADLLGTLAQGSFTYASDDATRKIGYIGKKRYIRATVTPSNNTGNLFMAGIWVLLHPRNAPQS